MSKKMILKILVDIAMTLILLLLMAYELVGQAAHEWLGVAIFVLFILHHILNGRWSRNVLKGRYTIPRIIQTLLVVLILITMIGSMYSGIILSRHALSFLPISGSRAFARSIHMLCAYWGFVLMSLHLGFHWNMMIGMVKKIRRNTSTAALWTARAFALLIAGYGAVCFVKRQIGSYMLLKIQFVFFDFSEALVRFLFDYIAIMGLFVFIGHYLFTGLKKIGQKKQK